MPRHKKDEVHPSTFDQPDKIPNERPWARNKVNFFQGEDVMELWMDYHRPFKARLGICDEGEPRS